MASESNEFINWEKDNDQQHLSVAVSYETELMATCAMQEGDGKEGGTADVDIELEMEQNMISTAQNGPVVTDESMDHSPKEQVVGGGEDTSCVPIAGVDMQMEQTTKEVEQLVDGDIEEVLPSGKRRGMLHDSADNRSRATKRSKLDNCSWEDLVSQVQGRLESVNADECFAKAIEIAVIARQQVQSRSVHLLNAFDMLGKGNQTAGVPSPTLTIHDPLQQWMQKYMELKHFHQINGHFDVPLDQPSYEALGKWVIEVKANASNLNSTQTHLLSRIGFPLDGALGNSEATIPAATGITADISSFPSIVQQPTKAAKTKARPLQLKVERGITTQQQIKMHRTTRFRTIEAVPCIKMTPPLPSKGDYNASLMHLQVPGFQSLCNFPNARFMNCCVMCDESKHPIPNQNKGVCNNCDSAVWIFVELGLQIKWCKGCKNFRKWVDFGEKGYSSKCQNCRTSQAQRYALAKNKKRLEMDQQLEAAQKHVQESESQGP